MAPGGLDVTAIRRVWPEVLGRIFTMRRATWTFVSAHAQVIDYDGQRLVLGIATTGLTQTFRQGNHAELIRQALIDEIGLDARVEGVPMPAGGIPDPRGGGDGPGDYSGGTGAAVPTSMPAAMPTPMPASMPTSTVPAPAPAAAGPDRSSGPTPAAPTASDRGARDEIPLPPEPPDEPGFEPPPDPADQMSVPPATPNHAGHVQTVRAELARAKEATRRTLDERHHRGGPTVASPAETAADPHGSEVDAVSLDDEIVEEGAELGQAVIERMLGGKVLGDSAP